MHDQLLYVRKSVGPQLSEIPDNLLYHRYSYNIYDYTEKKSSFPSLVQAFARAVTKGPGHQAGYIPRVQL